MKKDVKSASLQPSVLGTFTGKCCDSNVFNNNDMHLGREVFENLMKSDEYKRAMKYGHYVGFLGHPEDSDCQDDKNACIVMKDMRILDNGEIEGDFDLVNTPVGQVVKAMMDAGVKYGISIRGFGDVDGNGEVDPNEFIFRGFDLVRFPAYDDCIPEFKAIAASTDAKKQAQYKKICASINANLKSITSCEALELIQEQLPDGSDEFQKVQDRIDEIIAEPAIEVEVSDCDITQSKLDAMTDLYLDATARIRELETMLADVSSDCTELQVACKTTNMKYSKLRRITASQLETAQDMIDDMDAENEELKAQVSAATRQIRSIKASLSRKDEQVNSLTEEIRSTKAQYEKSITANTKLRNKISEIKADSEANIIEANDLNLKYKSKIEANSEAISQKDSEIEDLKDQLDKTVVENDELKVQASNLDEQNQELRSRVEAAEEMVFSYQQAYANIYANALGVHLTGLSITAETSVDELKRMINAGTSTAGISAGPSICAEEDVEESDEDFIDDPDEVEEVTGYSADMVSI